MLIFNTLIRRFFRLFSVRMQLGVVAVAFLPGSALAAADAAAPPAAACQFETDSTQIVLGANGQLLRFGDRASGENLLAPNQPSPLISCELVNEGLCTANALSYDAASGLLTVRLGTRGVTASVAVKARKTHVTFELQKVAGDGVKAVQFGPFPFALPGATVGTVVGVIRGPRLAVGIQALNIHTDAGASPTAAGGDLWARARQDQGGALGAKIALFCAASADALATIGQIELAEGLPHPLLGGVWGKVSPVARRSYFITEIGEANVDELLPFLKAGGFKYVYHPEGFQSWGHFDLKPEYFPRGDESLKAVTARLRQEDIRLGFHTLSFTITTNDPYIRPIPDPRLARTGESPLATDIDAKTGDITVAAPEPFRKEDTLVTDMIVTIPGEFHGAGTVMVDQELINYKGVSAAAPWRFGSIQRGAFGTTPAPHRKGAPVIRLAVGCGGFLPDVESTLQDEMVDRLLTLCNRYDLAQLSFDGLEAQMVYGKGVYAEMRPLQRFYDGLKGEVISDASNWYHYNWHIHTRMNWGELTQPAKPSIDHLRLPNLDYFEKNLYPRALGWWRFGTAASDWEATDPEDIEYLMAKCAGFDACHAMQSGLAALRNHARAMEVLGTVKAWDEARLAGAFTAAQKAKLREVGRDFHLEAVGAGQWKLYPIQVSPSYWLCSGAGRKNAPGPDQVLSFSSAGPLRPGPAWTVDNPFMPQPLRFQIRVLGGVDYDSADNIPLLPTDPALLKVGPNGDKPVPALACRSGGELRGLTALVLSAENTGSAKPSGTTRRSWALPQPLNLSKHRAVGLWVEGDGKGETLVVEMLMVGATRPYYIPIDFKGVKYVELPLGETSLDRYFENEPDIWPFDSVSSWWRTLKGFDYGSVSSIAVGFVNIPPGARVTCRVAGVKALREKRAACVNPRFILGAQTLTFPVSVPTDHYLVYDGAGQATVFDRNWNAVQRVVPQGALELPSGKSPLSFAYDAGKGAAPWVRVRLRSVGAPETVQAAP